MVRKKYKDNWLLSLKDSVPKAAYGYTISMYSIALEGWRRGLTLKFINNNQPKAKIDYSLSDGKNERFFSVTRGNKVPNSAVTICVNKHSTKKHLRKAGVPVPEGDVFGADVNDERIVQYSYTIGYPVVLKPSDGTGGNGVIANIKNEEELREAIQYVRRSLGFKEVILEKHFAGEDYRLYIIDNKVIGGLKKIPANVVGDGKNTIQYLIKKKNEERNSTPALYRRFIKIDKEMHNILKSKGYTLKSIPENGQQVFLKTKNNISAGGDPVDITDELTQEIKEIGIKASKAIPGLVQCGVDIMVDKESNTGAVLEVNSRPHITAQLYPWEGKARNIPKAIIDYYFPNTISQDMNVVPKFYFDFQSIFETFQSGYIKELVVPDIPKGNLKITRFIVSGEVQGVNYEKWVQRQARKLKINGFVKLLANGKVSVIASGSKKAIDRFRGILKTESSKRAKVTDVIEKERKLPIKVGFEIIDESGISKRKESSVTKKKQLMKKSQPKTELIDIVQDISNDGYFPVKINEKY